MNLETKAELSKTEESIHEPSMEQKSNQEQSNPEKDDPEVSPNSSDCNVGIFYNDELDFLEMQRVNNIMKAAYKEFMEIAIKANAWIYNPPAVGSVEDLQEMFHTPPPHGSTVEYSAESDVLYIPSSSLITIMMNGELWASMFSNIICDGSYDNVLTPLKTFWSSDSNSNSNSTDVILVNAQFRLPAEFLPRWCTRFLRFKMKVTENTWAICDVSTDYFEETTFEPTERLQYRRRPSGVVIRQFGFMSKVIWVENAEVQKIDIPKNMCSKVTSNFHLTARQWISIISQNLIRRHSKVLTSEMFQDTNDVPDLLTIGEKLRRVYLTTVNPFPVERKCDLYSDDKIRILRDKKASFIGYHNDYIASSTIYIPETPTRLLPFLIYNNVLFQWTSIKSPEQIKMAAAFATADKSYNICLGAKVKAGDDEAFVGHEFFLQESTADEYCSLVLSSQLTEEDIHISLLPTFGRNSVFLLRPSGFAVMPAEPGGLQSRSSLVTIYIRRELKDMEVDQAIEAMKSDMNTVIDQITNIRSPNAKNEADSPQNIPKQ